MFTRLGRASGGKRRRASLRGEKQADNSCWGNQAAKRIHSQTFTFGLWQLCPRAAEGRMYAMHACMHDCLRHTQAGSSLGSCTRCPSSPKFEKHKENQQRLWQIKRALLFFFFFLTFKSDYREGRSTRKKINTGSNRNKAWGLTARSRIPL